MIVSSVPEKQSPRLSTVTLASMHIWDRNLTDDKIMWDTRIERANEAKQLFQVQIKPFNHQAFYESYRNEIAVLLGKSYSNDTRNKLWSCQTLLKSYHTMYLQGSISEQDFKNAAQVTSRSANTFKEQEVYAD